MWQSESSIRIDAPVEAVYAYLADFRRHREWSHGVADLRPLSGNGSTHVGAEFEAAEVAPFRFKSRTQVTELKEPSHIAWEAWAGPVMHAEWSFDLTPDDGGTRVVQRCGFEPGNLMGILMLNLVRKRRVPSENRQSLQRIKEALERKPAPAANGAS